VCSQDQLDHNRTNHKAWIVSTNAVNNWGSSDVNDNEVEILPAMPADVDKWELQSVFSSNGHPRHAPPNGAVVEGGNKAKVGN